MSKFLKNWNSEVDKDATEQPSNIQALRLILCRIKDAYYISRYLSQKILQMVQIVITIQISHPKSSISDPPLAATYLQVS